MNPGAFAQARTSKSWSTNAARTHDDRVLCNNYATYPRVRCKNKGKPVGETTSTLVLLSGFIKWCE